ncbi:hypothetical protein TNCV_3078241 [Trichonephila clavipes]|nr:hypothetical protein TNCV_3078241 [Trichonephila clavipes]
MTVSSTPLQWMHILWVMFDLRAAARPWNPEFFNSRLTVLLLTLIPDELWNSWRNFHLRGLAGFCFTYNFQSSAVPKIFGLPVRFSAVSLPLRFHFTITSPHSVFRLL